LANASAVYSSIIEEGLEGLLSLFHLESVWDLRDALY